MYHRKPRELWPLIETYAYFEKLNVPREWYLKLWKLEASKSAGWWYNTSIHNRSVCSRENKGITLKRVHLKQNPRSLKKYIKPKPNILWNPQKSNTKLYRHPLLFKHIERWSKSTKCIVYPVYTSFNQKKRSLNRQPNMWQGPYPTFQYRLFHSYWIVHQMML